MPTALFNQHGCGCFGVQILDKSRDMSTDEGERRSGLGSSRSGRTPVPIPGGGGDAAGGLIFDRSVPVRADTPRLTRDVLLHGHATRCAESADQKLQRGSCDLRTLWIESDSTGRQFFTALGISRSLSATAPTQSILCFNRSLVQHARRFGLASSTDHGGLLLRATRACVGFHRCSRIYGKGAEDWTGGAVLGEGVGER